MDGNDRSACAVERDADGLATVLARDTANHIEIRIERPNRHKPRPPHLPSDRHFVINVSVRSVLGPLLSQARAATRSATAFDALSRRLGTR